MHEKNIVIVEAPYSIREKDKTLVVTREVEKEMERHSSHFDYYLIGGGWGGSLNGKNVLPVSEITQDHLDSSSSIIAGGHWFERWVYRPWRSVGQGEGKMFERKFPEDMPQAEWLRKEYKALDEWPYKCQSFAVVVDCHN